MLKRSLMETGADAAWVGWGFVAENPSFAELCEELGVTFIGPSPSAMRKLGDKINAERIAEDAGLPVAPCSRGPVGDLGAALRAARRIGYPVMLKAAAGGGGRGIRVIGSSGELTDAYDAPGWRPSGRSAAGCCSLRAWLPVPGTSRSR